MDRQQETVHIVGAGLAGSECAYQLAEMGYSVKLYEMRPKKLTPAHKTGLFGELVCSNSFGSQTDYSAPGQLKWEADQLGSLILKSARETAVPAGMSLSCDRERFAQAISTVIESHPNIEVVSQVIEDISDIPRPAVIATGPLTDSSLSESLRRHFGDEFCYFYDAIAPIIDTDSINMEIAFKANRNDQSRGDYINCPLNKDQYFQLMEEIEKAEKVIPKDFENTPYFEGCMPIEVMVERGPLTPKHGPMSPKGIGLPGTDDKWAYAIVQLRQDNKEGTAYNMVGFQTKMKYPEQKRIFRMIPGLEEAEFLKLGSIHRNLYIHSPKRLHRNLSSLKDPDLFFAGQITGVEGYFESTCIGLQVAHFVDQHLRKVDTHFPPRASAFGSLLSGITEEKDQFQPTNINFGLFPALTEPPPQNKRKWPKKEKRDRQLSLAKEAFQQWQVAESSVLG